MSDTGSYSENIEVQEAIDISGGGGGGDNISVSSLEASHHSHSLQRVQQNIRNGIPVTKKGKSKILTKFPCVK